MTYKVLLRKVMPRCPRCGGGRTVRTHAALGTYIVWRHSGKCSIRRGIALAGRYQDRLEVLPIDDRRVARHR